jgi:hypothetical protein
VELIIAAAITSIIISAVAALFVLALRAVKSGNAAMDANELTRAAFTLMERDLNTAFTSREHGEFFHFHGNEIGMSFIGLARGYDDTTDRETAQLGRVTYVISPSLLPSLHNNIDENNDGNDDFCDRYADAIYMERLDLGIDEMVEAQLVDFDCAAAWNDNLPIGVLTVSLVRYFEPGVESLDEYDPRIADRLDDAFLDGAPGIGVIEQQAVSVLQSENIRDTQIIDETRRIYRRDAYIRMLAQAALLDYDRNSAFTTSNPWKELFETERDPFDYVIAENILDLQSQKLLFNGDTSPYSPADFQRFPYFLYGETSTDINGLSIRYTPTWNAFDNMYEDDFVDGVPDRLKPSRTTDIDPQFHNKPQLGTPLEARLPEIVRVRLPFIFDSPYAGAPHMQRELVQDIRVPTAFTRRNPLAGLN